MGRRLQLFTDSFDKQYVLVQYFSVQDYEDSYSANYVSEWPLLKRQRSAAPLARFPINESVIYLVMDKK